MKQLWQKRKQRLTEPMGADAYTAALNSEWKEILPWLPLRTLLRRWGSMYQIHSNTMYLYLKFRNEHIHLFFVGNWLHEMMLTTLFNSTAVFKIVSIFHKTIFFSTSSSKDTSKHYMGVYFHPNVLYIQAYWVFTQEVFKNSLTKTASRLYPVPAS